VAVVIGSLHLATASATGQSSARGLDADTKKQVIEQVAEQLEAGYIYDEQGRELAAIARGQLAEGRYESIDDPEAFARALTEDLYGASNDAHLRVRYRPDGGGWQTPRRRGGSGGGRSRRTDSSYGIVGLEILDGNIGYMDLRMFTGSPEAEPRVAAAMAYLADADALIIDLRKNGGGAPWMVRYLSTYLFDERTHLASTFMRGWPEPRERWTFDEVQGRRVPDTPVYILTSGRTFSAAESFTFGLKNNDRVTIVGERTGGGGHFGGTVTLPGGFLMFLPNGRTYDPKTGQGWEAEGIRPDVEATAEHALDAALSHFRQSRGDG
jgi:hypothetical protein